ncbi:MAG: VOC family protein [Patescibacteria group bacterium]
MFNFNSLLISSENPKPLVEFYSMVVQSKPVWENAGFNGFKLGNGFIVIGPHDGVHGQNPSPEHIIFGMETTDVPKEFERIKATGAKVIAEPYHPSPNPEMWMATFADPDGNFFQLSTLSFWSYNPVIVVNEK